MAKNTPSKNQSGIFIPTPIAVILSLLLLATSFYSGYSWKRNSDPATNTIDKSKSIVFEAKKTSRPQLDFYVMSFCPYGNQIEDALRPVYDLLKDDVDFVPRYIFNKISNLPVYCQSTGDVKQCPLYVQNGYFQSEADCKKIITDAYNKCMDTNNYVKAENGTMYSALHGRQEANQNIREICAWNMLENKDQWWTFVDNVNRNCNYENADACWESQAKIAGLDTQKITECFNKEGINLIEKEIALTTKNNVSSSPTVLINDVFFPPESAYAQDGKGSLKIGKKYVTQDKFRDPNVIKEAVCASFNRSPKECKTTIDTPTTDQVQGAATGGGC